MGQNVILIPSLEPDRNLVEYIEKLQRCGLSNIVVVDDGSGTAYAPVFQALRRRGATVLRHEVNRGKGCALKTGLRYIAAHIPDYSCVVTVDSDGQHAVEDVCRMIGASRKNPDALILGERDFRAAGVPAKSLWGNRIIAAAFAAFYGRRLADTQTGLRAFGPALTERLLALRGRRFEYEIQMLIFCEQARIPIISVPIRTIYQKGNAGTHFQALRDSTQIMSVLLLSFLRFSSSSLFCAGIDLGIAWTLLDMFRPVFGRQEFLRILLATAAARCISVAANYQINRRFVFGGPQPGRHNLPRYLLLCAAVLLLSGSGVYLLHTACRIDEKWAKLICDTFLFFLSYRFQQTWVFRARKVKI